MPEYIVDILEMMESLQLAWYSLPGPKTAVPRVQTLRATSLA